ncbi:LPD7 domain-containing protein [Sulfuriferula thiophila]|uniref:LPD7 domain-containing protein n=1 Tax=Sulfuriferula thiophila TaxID=1781211 RepID=UPI000F60EA12|nr:LPD7 domain-containing protein [Sulfuriferula thiophila]
MATGIIFKVALHNGAENIGRHLGKTDDNEIIESDADARDFVLACEEMKAQSLSASSRGDKCKRTLLHVSVSPERDLSLVEWQTIWHEYETEFGLEGQPFLDVKHVKARVDGSKIKHCHRVYAAVHLLTGRAIDQKNNFARQEKLARVLESTFGMMHIKGRFNCAVEAQLRDEGKTSVADSMSQAGLLVGKRPIADIKSWENELAKRTGTDLSETRDLIALAFLSSSSQLEFIDKLNVQGLNLFRGYKVPIVVAADGGEYPLLRSITRSILVIAQNRTIKKYDIDKIIDFGSLPLLASNQQDRAKQLAKISTKLTETPQGGSEYANSVSASEQVLNDNDMRIKSIAARYGDDLAKMLKNANIIETAGGNIAIYSFGASVIDKGSVITTSHRPNQKSIDLIMDLAASKGWQKLHLSGTVEFKKMAAIEARKRGFDVHDKKLAAMADARIEEELEIAGLGRAIFESGADALDTVSISQLKKIVDQNIKDGAASYQLLNEEITELEREIAAMPEATNDIYYIEMPDLKRAFEARDFAFTQLQSAKSRLAEAGQHRILGMFKRKHEKQAEAKLTEATEHYDIKSNEMSKMVKSIPPDIKQRVSAILARKSEAKSVVEKMKLTRASGMPNDWVTVRDNLRQYGPTLTRQRITIKGKSAVQVNGDILRMATTALKDNKTKAVRRISDMKSALATVVGRSAVEADTFKGALAQPVSGYIDAAAHNMPYPS